MKHIQYYVYVVAAYLIVYFLSHHIIYTVPYAGYNDVIISYTILDKFLEVVGISVRYGMIRLISICVALHYMVYGAYTRKNGKPHRFIYLIAYSIALFALIPVIW